MKRTGLTAYTFLHKQSRRWEACVPGLFNRWMCATIYSSTYVVAWRASEACVCLLRDTVCESRVYSQSSSVNVAHAGF